ncbi:hypothetical protein [Roseateles saccharophilus]|uniref:hypothetical protein n=1 Tax=Roseateles saccharophilus TaxID=304 RepID=UPI00104DA50F|nr:hypothetical protein [Roseateles saccharophilus]MDG0831881.1 hypothetical protein [Roseateles saccharophilus]
MNQDKPWPQTQADGPLLLALFDAGDGLLQANAAFRQAWGLADTVAPTWAGMAEAARRAGAGPVEQLPRRGRIAQRGYEQAWSDGRRLWWVEQRLPDGGLALTGVDISALDRPRPLTGQLLAAQAGRELLQALLADPRAWPLSVATLAADADAATLLARIRGEDGCMRLDDGRLLVMLPSTGPAQAAALGERLGALVLTEAVWGEPAAALIARA